MASAAAKDSPIISIITPARNAAKTLERMIGSVRSQGIHAWELLIVVGPSSDDTAAIAEKWANKDPRISCRNTESISAGMARNEMLAAAQGDHVLFLDADDTIGRNHLGRLIGSARESGADVVLSGCRRIAPDGKVISRHRSVTVNGEAPDLFQKGPVAALHAMLFSRELVTRLGGFDHDLQTHEDWDLCLRAARAGCRFVSCDTLSANYWITPGSLTSNADLMAVDRAEVAQRIQESAADNRGNVEVAGDFDSTVAAVSGAIRTALWGGAAAIARGNSPDGALSEIRKFTQPVMHYHHASDAVLEGLAVGFGCRFEDIGEKAEGKWDEIHAFLHKVAVASGDVGLDIAVRNRLEAEIARLDPGIRAKRIGGTQMVPVLPNPFRKVASEADCTQVVLRVPMARPRGQFTFSFAPVVAQRRSAGSLVWQRAKARASEIPIRDRTPLARSRDLAAAALVRIRHPLVREPKARPTHRIPVLMFHGVTNEGPEILSQWRLTPENFEQKISFLRREGYRSISIDEWERAERLSGAVPARSILITFDDGLKSFADFAWPILKEHGFSAHMFAVTGMVGTSAEWDSGYGEVERLMDWAELISLGKEGVSFGSHMHRHIDLTRMSDEDIVKQAVMSKAMLEEWTGQNVTTIAPPYGTISPRIAELLSMAGYRRMFRASGGIAPVVGANLDTPRINVQAGWSLEQLEKAIDTERRRDGTEPCDER
jgi:peptidoglycan/xylan/chitin deacetylase (PgdA/CDA1 family)